MGKTADETAEKERTTFLKNRKDNFTSFFTFIFRISSERATIESECKINASLFCWGIFVWEWKRGQERKETF